MKLVPHSVPSPARHRAALRASSLSPGALQRGILSLLALTACFLPAPFAMAQAALSVENWNYTARSWQSQNGLPGETVQAFSQTQDGYLWIGTSEGLVRFDGARFTFFTHENTPPLRESSVFCLLTTHDGSLWIGTEGGGLTELRNGVFRAYTAADGLTGSSYVPCSRIGRARFGWPPTKACSAQRVASLCAWTTSRKCPPTLSMPLPRTMRVASGPARRASTPFTTGSPKNMH